LVGTLCLLAGFATRLWTISILILFLDIIITTHAANGFFMNRFGSQPGEGCEFDLLVIGLSLALLLNGSGRLSIDQYI
jgi:putative oxidoreductase